MRRAILSTLLLTVCLLAASQRATSQQRSEQEANKQVARDFIAVLDQGRLDQYSESHAPDFVAHGRTHDATLEQDLAAAREERKAMPDMRMKINEIMAERDLVLVYWTVSGTNTHEGMGFPATGKAITVSGMTLFRLRGGKISEEWSVWDMLSVMQQAGLVPAQP